MQHLLPARSLLLLCKQLVATTKAGLLASLVLLLAAAANPASATGFYKDFVVVNGSYYYTNLDVKNSNIRNFKNAELGEYNLGDGEQLRLGSEATTFSDNGDAVQSPQMYYRIYPQGAPANSRGGFAALNLRFAYSNADGNPTNQSWNNVTDNPDLLASVGMAGTYVLELYYFGTATYNNPGGSGSFVFYDSNNSNNYTATFKVVGTRPVFATWVGGSSTGTNNWFDAANWSSGRVPTSNTDVSIPYPTSSNANVPRISDGVATTRNLTILSDPNQSPLGTSLQQFNGELQVYGDFADDRNNFQQNTGTLTLAGSNNQTFQGGRYANVRITGGTTKFLRGLMFIANTLVFVGSGGVLSTGVTNVSQQGVVLSSDAAYISGETESSYVLGALSASRTVMNNIPEYFGFSGIDLRVTSGNPGIVLMTRVTGYYFSGVGNSQSILRGYNFTPGQNNPASNVNNLTFDLTFHYRDSELNKIQENDLRLFRSVTSTAPFEGLAFTSMDASANTLTRTGITGTLAATFTLGNVNNPLPVELVSFTAAGTAQGAALKWLTASEVNNKGFGVERQVAGATTWQPVGYVAATNLANGSSYSFLDKTIPASATQVYYRLRQEDFDGSLHYSAVATISRATQGADLTLSPVPLQSGPLAVSFAEVGQAGTEILVLNMQGQRVARYTTAASTDGAVSLPLDNLAAGVYVVSVQVPGQATRRARFVKQ